MKRLGNLELLSIGQMSELSKCEAMGLYTKICKSIINVGYDNFEDDMGLLKFYGETLIRMHKAHLNKEYLEKVIETTQKKYDLKTVKENIYDDCSVKYLFNSTRRCS